MGMLHPLLRGLRARLRRGLRRGFTLIELMVAIVIAAFVVAALYGLFTVQSRQFLMQDLYMEMHQNLRFSTDMLTRSIRMAGFGASGWVAGPFGYSGSSASSAEIMPTMISYDGGGNAADAITVVYAEPSLVMDTINTVVPVCGTDELLVRPTRPGYAEKLQQFSAGELLMCYDFANSRGRESYMWELSSAPDSTTGRIPIIDNTIYDDYNTVCPTNENLTPIMTCSKANVLTFYIDADDTDGVGPGSEAHPVLMLDMDMSWPDATDVPLADEVEDLQLEYCVDSGNADVDCSLPGNWSDDFDADHPERVWMVRVSLVVRSSRTDLMDLKTIPRPGIANRGAGPDDDTYFRQWLVTEVAVRNNRAQVGL
jgi:prepilin-type N-terminal cleavage/methylation domain-containing protein